MESGEPEVEGVSRSVWIHTFRSLEDIFWGFWGGLGCDLGDWLDRVERFIVLWVAVV